MKNIPKNLKNYRKLNPNTFPAKPRAQKTKSQFNGEFTNYQNLKLHQKKPKIFHNILIAIPLLQSTFSKVHLRLFLGLLLQQLFKRVLTSFWLDLMKMGLMNIQLPISGSLLRRTLIGFDFLFLLIAYHCLTDFWQSMKTS